MAVHPHLYLCAEAKPGLRSVDDLRRDIESGESKELWERLVGLAEKTVADGPVLVNTALPGRPEVARATGHLDAVVCVAAGEQLMRCALVHLVTGREEFKAAAMRQLEVIYDPERWPDWVDDPHRRFGNVDLRTGSLSRDVGVAYDWLAPSLTEKERAWVIEGLDRRGIQPYLEILKTDPWWTHDLHNWLTVIVGGLGVAGMALDGEQPDAQKLIDFALPKMEEFLTIYGPEGEYNESVGYSSANRFPVNFYLAHRYWSGGRQNRLAEFPFPETCRWVMQTTLPPGRSMGFGDTWVERAVIVEYIGAVAAANGDGVLQWFYQQYRSDSINALEFVTYDPRVEPVAPEGREPLAKFYKGQGRIAVSRTDWDPEVSACIVYGKAGREDNHDHDDLGQLCIDGYRERLIIDPGSPSSYPEEYFDGPRADYYNLAVRGHNVLMFDREQQWREPDVRGEKMTAERHHGAIVAQLDEPGIGAGWKMDLTPVYKGAVKITRTVLHLLPGYVAVLDEAELSKEQEVSLRWHTRDQAEPDEQGRFVVKGTSAQLAGMVTRLDEGEVSFERKEQIYEPPHDKGRLGAPLEARRESYVEATLRSDRCRLLTLFCVKPAAASASAWAQNEAGWSIDDVQVSLTDQGLTVGTADGSRAITL